MLNKRRAELVNMQDRLLNAFLGGTIEESVYTAKSNDLRNQLEEVERGLDEGNRVTEENGRLALTVFDFSQNLGGIWQSSNLATRKEILECVTSNRQLFATSLCLTKRKPFDILAEVRNLDDGGRNRIRTCDPLRVKQVL